MAVGGRVLVAVGNPDVGDAGLAERLSDGGADLATAHAMFNPKLANGRVTMRQREAVGGFRMRKTGGIEIESDAARLRPSDPVPEMFRFNFVAIHLAPAEFAVESVEVE